MQRESSSTGLRNRHIACESCVWILIYKQTAVSGQTHFFRDKGDDGYTKLYFYTDSKNVNLLQQKMR